MALEAQPELPKLDVATLGQEPAVSQVDDAILTAPQSALGFLWALGEEGSLYRINPFQVSGSQVEVRTRFWQGKRPHAFTVRRLRRGGAPEEPCAVVATAASLMIWGLISQRLDRFDTLLEGESILCDARSAYELVEASGEYAFCLVQRGGSTSLLRLSLASMTAERLPFDTANARISGPVWVQGNLVVWSETALWTLDGQRPERHEVPPGVSLWRGPKEDAVMRIPLGRSPAIVSGQKLYLPCDQQGGPALLLAQRGETRWTLAVIPISHPGVLVEDMDRNPLFTSDGTLAVCQAGSFRTELTDGELSGQLAAFHRKDLSLFFCEARHGNATQQWLRARVAEQDKSVAWQLAPNRRIMECSGFWPFPGGLTAQMLIEDRFVRTEFVSWHD